MALGFVHFYSAVIFELCLYSAVDGTISCTFDDGFCGWHNARESYELWRNNSGQTADRTSGPLNDHTLKNITGQYVYVSGINFQKREDTALLESEPISIPMVTSFSFWYLMNGYGTGMLVLEQLEGSHKMELWKKSGQQNKDWSCGVVELKPGSNVTLRFKATMRLPIGSDIALDDVQLQSEHQDLNTQCGLTTAITTITKDTISSTRQVITKHTLTAGLPTTSTLTSTRQASTEGTTVSSTKEALSTTSVECVASLSNMTVLPGTCDFEKDFCNMTVRPDHSNPNVTWARTNQMEGDKSEMEDNIHGDHTFLNSNVTRGFYAHFVNDESSNALPHETAILETPTIRSSYVCLTFWYVLPTKQSKLVVLLNYIQSNPKQIWAMDNMKYNGTTANLQTKWLQTSLPIKESSSFKIIFQALNSDRSTRVGIDDIKITGTNTEQSTFTTIKFTSSAKTSTEVLSLFSTTKLKHSTKMPTTQQAVDKKPTADKEREAADTRETAKIVGSGIGAILALILIIIMTYLIVNITKCNKETGNKDHVSSALNKTNKDSASDNNDKVDSNIHVSMTRLPHKARIHPMDTNDVITNATISHEQFSNGKQSEWSTQL